jgi:hypothetical protein
MSEQHLPTGYTRLEYNFLMMNEELSMAKLIYHELSNYWYYNVRQDMAQ